MDFNLFKKKATETAGIIADKSAAFAKLAADKTKLAAKIAKLKTEIAAERDTLRKGYAELGKTCYEMFKDSPAETMAQNIAEITASLEHIEALNKEIEALKAEDAEGEADVEVDFVVEKADEAPAETPAETPAEPEAAPEETEKTE